MFSHGGSQDLMVRGTRELLIEHRVCVMTCGAELVDPASTEVLVEL